MATEKKKEPGPPRLRPLAVRGVLCALLAAGLFWSGGAGVVLIAAAMLQAACDLTICAAGVIGRRAGGPPPRRRFRYSKLASPIRESWKVIPAHLQPALTRLAGKPGEGEPARDPGARAILLAIAAKLVFGVTLSAAGVAAGGGWFLLVLPGWVFATSAVRHLALTVVHETAGHDEAFTRDKETDRLVGETAAVVSVSQNYDAYKPEHKGLHHGPQFMTPADPTIKFLNETLGITRGMSRVEAWARLLFTIFTPWYQVSQTVKRVRTSWRGSSRFHRRGLLIHLALVAALATFFPVTVCVGWVVPLVFATNAVIGVRMCLEHVYPPFPITSLRSPQGVCGSTHALFFGVAAPSAALPWFVRGPAWLLWAVVTGGYVLPCKLLLAPGASAAHDLHHLKPRAGVCPDPVYARQEYLADRPADAPPLTEVWGAVAAVDDLFASLRESRAH